MSEENGSGSLSPSSGRVNKLVTQYCNISAALTAAAVCACACDSGSRTHTYITCLSVSKGTQGAWCFQIKIRIGRMFNVIYKANIFTTLLMAVGVLALGEWSAGGANQVSQSQRCVGLRRLVTRGLTQPDPARCGTLLDGQPVGVELQGRVSHAGTPSASRLTTAARPRV